MKNIFSSRGHRFMRHRLAAILTVIGLLFSIMLTAYGCNSENNVVIDIDPVVSSGDTLSGSDISGSDISGTDSTAATSVPTTAALTTTDVAVRATSAPTRYPQDHEDVFAPDYQSDYYIIVYTLNCSTLVLQKDENGKYTIPVKTFLCSPGADDSPTKPGVYVLYRRHVWRYMMQVYGHYCSGFGDGTGYLFHSVPYLEEENNTLSTRYDDLGTRASHGCVRLCTRDAKWIFDNIPFGTQVHVIDDKNGPPADPVPMRNTAPRYRGWDPTDPDPINPYNRTPPEELTYFTHTSAGTQPTTTVAAQ